MCIILCCFSDIFFFHCVYRFMWQTLDSVSKFTVALKLSKMQKKGTKIIVVDHFWNDILANTSFVIYTNAMNGNCPFTQIVFIYLSIHNNKQIHMNEKFLFYYFFEIAWIKPEHSIESNNQMMEWTFCISIWLTMTTTSDELLSSSNHDTILKTRWTIFYFWKFENSTHLSYEAYLITKQ